VIRSDDTSAEAHAQQLEAWRRMTPEERLAVAAEMSDALRRLVEAGVRSRHPDATGSEVRALIVAAMLGPELVASRGRRQAERIE
jgi:acyl-CoA reductase-like NAD-dependent aldehyde dehydrogenase